VQDSPNGVGQREDAAYVAGLAAYQLGDRDEAERRFILAARSPNSETAARSKAMLGQIRLDQHRPRDAAALFVEAAPNLHGEDARLCAYNAGVAYQQAGDNASARKWIAQSGGGSTARSTSTTGSTSSPVARSASTSSAGGFTLQVGAFKEKSRAQKAAADAQKLATRDGLGSVKIQTRRDDRGGTLYVVQFGRFSTRDAAVAARVKLNRLDYIVAPA
jgi:septal ring-binding cell division protein DamX